METNFRAPSTLASSFGIYRCPRTRKPLLTPGQSPETAESLAGYPLTDGVPDIRQNPSPDTEDELKITEILAAAKRTNWRQAFNELRPEWLSYIDSADRAIFLSLLDSKPQGAALEIGPGIGQFLVHLSPRFAEVHGLELSPAQARLCTLRCRQDGFNNVFVAAGGDDLWLPYADASFDTVIFNHVFEWVRLPDDQGGHAEAQKRVLAEIFRVLKPDGQLFLGTKNRFSLKYLLGGKDENAKGMRFGNAMPRWLTQAMMKGRKGRFALLHSHGGLSRLLLDAGFNDLKSYWATPSTRFPKAYVPTNSSAIRAARATPDFKQGESRGTRFLMPLIPAALVPYVTPGLAFVARKP